MPTPHIQSSHFYSNSSEKRIKNFYSNHMGFMALDIALVAVSIAFVLLLVGGTPFLGLVLLGTMLGSLVAVRVLETIKLWWHARQDRLFSTQISHLAPELRTLITDKLEGKKWTVSQARRFLQLVYQSKNQNYGDLQEFFHGQQASAEDFAPYKLFYIVSFVSLIGLVQLEWPAVMIAGASIPLGLIVAPLLAILGTYLLARAATAAYEVYQERQFSRMAALAVHEDGFENEVLHPAKIGQTNDDALLSQGMFSGKVADDQPVPPPAYSSRNRRF